MLNLKKLEYAMSEAKISKAKLCARTKLARTTLDAILNGSDLKISTLETIAAELNKPVAYFFDEDVEVEEYVAPGKYGMAVKHVDKVDQREGSTSAADADTIADLRDQIAQLKSQLADKERIIQLLEKS